MNPLKKFESFMRAIFEAPFVFFFPTPVQPAQVRRLLELEMEDNLVPQEGRILASNLYFIYVSSRDYNSLSPSRSIHVTDWQNHLIDIALQRHYTLKTRPILLLKEDTSLRLGKIRILTPGEKQLREAVDQVHSRLELAIKDNLVLQGEGQRLAPNLYTIYVSNEYYLLLLPSISIHVTDWQNHLVEIARQRNYTLKTSPILQLKEEASLRMDEIHIQATLVDKEYLNAAAGTLPGAGTNNSGLMETRAISPEQLAQIRAQAAGAAGAQNSGPFSMGSSSPGQPGAPMQSYDSNPNYPGHPAYPGTSSLPSSPLQPVQPVINRPLAVLSIRLPQADEQIYYIEKPVIKIGRQLNNDIIVEDKRVSRYHAQIKLQPNRQFEIFDLGSTNGITINGTPQQRHHILQDGDCFTIGSYEFYFQRM